MKGIRCILTFSASEKFFKEDRPNLNTSWCCGSKHLRENKCVSAKRDAPFESQLYNSTKSLAFFSEAQRRVATLQSDGRCHIV